MIENKHILLAASLLLTLASCTKEPGRTDAGSITVQATIGQMTKVDYTADGIGTSFTAGDKIAVYGWTGSADEVPATRVVDGVVNTLGTDAKWTPENPMLWKNVRDEHYFLGVFPARTITDFTADPYTLDPANYEESDLLIATNVTGLKAQDNPVALTFEHAMAKLVVNLKFRSQWNATPVVSRVSISSKTKATVDYLAKSVTATGSASEVGLVAASSAPDGYALCYSGLVVPQDGVRKVTISIEGKTLVFESATDIPLKSGEYITLCLNVGRDEIGLGSIDVTDWTAGTVLPDADAVEAPPVITETIIGCYAIQSSRVWGGTGLDYGGGALLDPSAKTKCWYTSEGFGPGAEYDDYLEITLDRIMDNGNTTGKCIHYGGVDGKHWNCLFKDYDKIEGEQDIDVHNFYRQIPVGESTWVRDYVNGTISFTDKDGHVTTGEIYPAGEYQIYKNDSRDVKVTVPDMAFVFKLAGVDDWDHLFTDYDILVKNPRLFMLLVTPVEEIPAASKTEGTER